MSTTIQSTRTCPLISVITVCYNAVNTIEECIQSVFAQDFADVEYVIIDGGSVDGTVEVIRKHECLLSYWHSRPDRGIGHAFNIGLERSRGQWILFLNADDYFCRNDALKILARKTDSTNTEVIYGRVQRVSRDSHPKPVRRPVGWPYAPWKFLLRDVIPHPAAITSRSYFQRVGPFSEDFRIVIDYELYLRSFKTLRTIFVPEVLTHMRVGGISQDSASTLDEMFQAQRRNGVLHPFANTLLECGVRSKAALARVVRKGLERSGF